MPVNKTRRKIIKALPVLPALGIVSCAFESIEENKMPPPTTTQTADDAARQSRSVVQVIPGIHTSDGAGVQLRRYIGSHQLDYLDPFLLMDEFSSNNPNDYLAGFPPHPHRGMETVTYMIEGKLEHEDSLGNNGVINKGDAQWMTAGSGIIHSEMPAMKNGLLRGLQLWVNLPAKDKMGRPMYRELKAHAVSTVETENSVVRVVAGTYQGTTSAFGDIAGNPTYLDVSVKKGKSFTCDIAPKHNIFAFVLEGEGLFGSSAQRVEKSSLAIFERVEKSVVYASSLNQNLRFILASGAPLNEPVARGGPFVMNTQAEIQSAWDEYREGTFIKQQPVVNRQIFG